MAIAWSGQLANVCTDVYINILFYILLQKNVCEAVDVSRFMNFLTDTGVKVLMFPESHATSMEKQSMYMPMANLDDSPTGPHTPPLEHVPEDSEGTGQGSCDLNRKRRLEDESAYHTPAKQVKGRRIICSPSCIGMNHPYLHKNTLFHIFAAGNILIMNLFKLQPLARVSPMIAQGTVVLLYEASLHSSEVLKKANSENGGLAGLICAAFWLVAKLGGIRDLTPNAQLMSMAAKIQKSDLVYHEKSILEALNWDVLGALRRHEKTGLDVSSLIF